MTLRIIVRNMSQSIATKLIQNAERAEKRLAELQSKLAEVRKFKIEENIKILSQENELLLKKIEEAKIELINLENSHGKTQYGLPGKTIPSPVQVQVVAQENVKYVEPSLKKEKEKDPAKKPKDSKPAAKNDDIVDIRKLDLRIGKIIDINKHPDADSLYVEKIDCGEDTPRTVVSGLVNHVPIDEMRDRIVMVLCNLKPAKMRGVTSEAMVMCASSTEKVEVLIPPSNSVPGDLVFCEGYPREPEAQLNPKKKIFETCAPDLKTNNDAIACYKDNPLVVPEKGPVRAPTLKGVSVK